MNMKRMLLLVSIVSALVIGGFTDRTACADDGDLSHLPDGARKALKWFPSNTTGIRISDLRDVSLVEQRTDDQQLMSELTAGTSLRILALPQYLALIEKYDSLSDRRIQWAVHGSKNTDAFSAFGSFRYEGCLIVHLSKPLKHHGRTFLSALEETKKEIRTIGDEPVARYPPEYNVEVSPEDRKDWEGFYVAVPSRQMILVGTSDRLMRRVLQRMNARNHEQSVLRKFKFIEEMDPNGVYWALRRKKTGADPVRLPDYTLLELIDRSATNKSLFRIIHERRGRTMEEVEEIWTIGQDEDRITPASVKNKDGLFHVEYPIGRIKMVQSLLFMMTVRLWSTGG